MYKSIKELAITIANQLVGTKEFPVNSNRGLVIDKIQSLFNFKGQQYCVIFVLYCYLEACIKLKINFPFPKTASSQSLFEDAKAKGFVYYDPKFIKPGDIVIWRKLKLWQGHAGLITSVLLNNNTFRTIEGNTSNSNFGSQSDGDGIYKRIRSANKLNFSFSNFYIRGFINSSLYF